MALGQFFSSITGTRQTIKHTFGNVASMIACIVSSGCFLSFSSVGDGLDTGLGLRTGLFVEGLTIFTGLAV